MFSTGSSINLVCVAILTIGSTYVLANGTPCDPSDQPHCTVCTCFDPSGYSYSEGGVFFFETFDKCPIGWFNSSYGGSGGMWEFDEDAIALVSNPRSSQTIDHWYFSPPIATDSNGLLDLVLTFSAVFEGEEDFLELYTLVETIDTVEFFTGAYANHLITMESTEVLSEESPSPSDISALIATFISDGKKDVTILEEKNNYISQEFNLNFCIGSRSRVAFRSNRGEVILDDIALHYQKSKPIEYPKTPDFEGSCCGGADDVSHFIPGELWGGYAKDCNGEALAAIDVLIDRVDYEEKVVQVTMSILIYETISDCHGSWKNELIFNEMSKMWEFGRGNRASEGGDNCSDRVSMGRASLCLGGKRAAICGISPNGTCEGTFSLRRSEKPNTQFVYSWDPNDFRPIEGSMKDRWARSVSVGGRSSEVYYYMIDDFGRLHAFGDPKELSITAPEINRGSASNSFVLSFMLGKDLTSVVTGFSNTFLLADDGAVYAYGQFYAALGRGFRYDIGKVDRGVLKFLPRIKKLEPGIEAFVAMSQDDSVWVWGVQDSNLGFKSSANNIFIPVPSVIFNEQIKTKDVKVPFLGASVGYANIAYVSQDNKVYISGFNFQSDLGFDSTDDVLVPTLHPKIKEKILMCSSGAYHNLCVTLNGTLIGWGYAVVFAGNVPVYLDFEVFSEKNIALVQSRNLLNFIRTDDGSVYVLGYIDSLSYKQPEIINETKSMPIASLDMSNSGALLVKDLYVGAEFKSATLDVQEHVGMIEIPVERLTDYFSDVKPLTLYVSAHLKANTDYSSSSSEHRRSLDDASSFELLTETLSWSPGDYTKKFIHLNILDDTMYVAKKNIIVEIYRDGMVTKYSMKVIVHDNGDAGKLCFVDSFLRVHEDEGIINVKVNRSLRGRSEVSAYIHSDTFSGEALNQAITLTNGSFIFYNSTLIWSDEDRTTKVASVMLINDDIYKGPRQFSLHMEPDGGAEVDQECSILTVEIVDDGDGGEIIFEVSNVTSTVTTVTVRRTHGNSGETTVKLQVLDNLPSSRRATITEEERDFEYDSSPVVFRDRDVGPYTMDFKLRRKSSRKVVNFQATIIGSATFPTGGKAFDLEVPLGEDSRVSSVVIAGAIIGVFALFAVIAVGIFYRTKMSHNERLRSQWLIEYDLLEDIDNVGGRLSSTATYIGSRVFVEDLVPQVSQQGEAIFTKYVVLHHPNVDTFIGVCFAPTVLITEYCSKGGLDNALEDGKIPFNTDFKASLCSDASQGMAYLHAKGITHGMLDLSKLVVNSRFVCKIAGVALQPWLSRPPPCDLVCWLAPEQLKVIGPRTMDDSSDQENIPLFMEKSDIEQNLSDLYSFGMVVFAIFTENAFPYEMDVHIEESARFKREALRISIVNDQLRPVMPPDLTDAIDGVWRPEGKEMKTMAQVQRCWAQEPLMRPSFQELVKHFQAILPSHSKVMESMDKKYLEHMEELVSSRTQELRHEKEDTEVLLSNIHTLVRNIMPNHIVDRLQSNDLIADKYPSVSIFYSEVVSFSEILRESDASDIINLFNGIFPRMDTLAVENQVERVKTDGDSYIAICGAPTVNKCHEQQILFFALAVNDEKFIMTSGNVAQLRIGIETGSVYSGVVGTSRIAYDIWGPAVTTAKAIAEIAPENKVCVSRSFYMKVCNNDSFSFIDGPKVDEKLVGGGPVYMAVPLSEGDRVRIRDSFNSSNNTQSQLGTYALGRKEKVLAMKNMVKVASANSSGYETISRVSSHGSTLGVHRPSSGRTSISSIHRVRKQSRASVAGN